MKSIIPSGSQVKNKMKPRPYSITCMLIPPVTLLYGKKYACGILKGFHCNTGTHKACRGRMYRNSSDCNL